jgi:hypothetical protein
VAWAIVGGLVLCARAAVAQTEPPVPASAEHWYGWQTLVADACAVGIFAAAWVVGSGGYDQATKTRTETLAYISLGTFVLGGPIVHAAHGHWGKAGISFALRVGLPILGAAAAFAATDGSCSNADGGCGGAASSAVVFLFGIATAVTMDAGLLATEPIAAPTRQQPVVAFTPLRRGAGVSMIGRF